MFLKLSNGKIYSPKEITALINLIYKPKICIIPKLKLVAN